MIFRKKSPLSVVELADRWTEKVVNLFEEKLSTVILFGIDDSFNSLTHDKPGLVFLFKKWDATVPTILKEKGITANKTLIPFFLTNQELGRVSAFLPLDLFNIRSNCSCLYGDETVLSFESDKNGLYHHIMSELQAILIHLRGAPLHSQNEQALIIIATMNRLIPVFRGILFLRGSQLPSGWSATVSDIESSCNLSTFSLSAILSDLEHRKKANLHKQLIPLQSVLEELTMAVG